MYCSFASIGHAGIIIIIIIIRNKLQIYKVLTTQVYYNERTLAVFIDLYERSLLPQLTTNFVYMQESGVGVPVKDGNKTVGVRGFFGMIWCVLEKKMNFT